MLRIPAPRAAALLLFSSVLAGRANAQGTKPPVTIPSVEVVATRIPEAPHDVPMSIEVISGADLRARNAITLREALSLATGIAIAPGGDAGPASAVPEIWGLREFDAFLLVVDGIPWGGAFNPAIATLSMRDVERIEILRGPAPVTYGATSFVGVIHVVHTAAAQTARYATVHAGQYGTGGASIELPLPVVSAWKSRLSADGERMGFKDDNTSYSRGHAALRTATGEGDHRTWLTADLNILHQEPASPHVRQGTSLSTTTPLDANYNPKDAFLDEVRFALSAGLERSVMQNAVWGTSASYTFSPQSVFRGFLTDVANTPNNAAGFREDIEIQDVYADSHIIWPTMNNVRFMAGVDLLFANGEGKGATFNYTVPLSGASQASVTEPTIFNADAESRRLFGGAYGSAEWRPTTRLALSAGLRVNATRESRGEGASVTHTRPSGSVGALLGLWESGEDHVRTFVNYRDTFKPAAFDFSLAENEGVLEPETSRSYEGGVKIRTLDARLDLEASVFRMDFNNIVVVSVVNNLPALTNAGDTRFQGVELAADARLPYDLHVRGTYSFHDGKFVNYVTEFDGVNTQLAGKRFEMSARHLASAGLVLAPEYGLVASVTMNYSGDRYLNKRNTALADAFTTIDAGVGFRVNDWEFRVDGRNLGDRRDAVSESEFGDAQYYRMPARSLRAGIAVRY
ncbi:MAG: TonB-dependent receptor [Gemmatimonadetes bacterium]|nr:TonB-dependent receptor [Gemmatimonadota bacterium]